MLWKKAKAEYAKDNRLYHNESYLQDGFNFFKSVKINLSLEQELAWLAHMVSPNESNFLDTSKSKVWLEACFKKVKLESGERFALQKALEMVDAIGANKVISPDVGVLLDARLVRFAKKYDEFKQDEQMLREEFVEVPLEIWVEQVKSHYEVLQASEFVFHTPLARHYWNARAKENLEAASFAPPAYQQSLLPGMKR
jgi:predicted metal-dependent HD superfamily phosphohydrolase